MNFMAIFYFLMIFLAPNLSIGFSIIIAGLTIVNDLFINTFVIMYNLEITIGPSYSLIVIMKSVCEAIFSAALLPIQ